MDEHAGERFGNFLRETRTTLGLTQREAADKAGLSQTSISSLERGNTDAFTFAQAVALARLYVLTLDTFAELLQGKEVTPAAASLDALVHTLDEAQRTFVHTVVVTLLKGLR